MNIQPKEAETKEFLINNKLIVNLEEDNLLNELKRCLSECEKFYFSVASINFSGLRLLLDSFKEPSDKIPIKRIYEFSILKCLLNNDEISIEKAKNEILKHIDYVDDESVIYALNCLNGSYYDSGQIKDNVRCF